MDLETFAAVDALIGETLVPGDEALQGWLDAAENAGLPQIQVSPPQGRLLEVQTRPSRPQRRLHEMLAANSRVGATTIQTVGSKGYDGFTIALVSDG